MNVSTNHSAADFIKPSALPEEQPAMGIPLYPNSTQQRESTPQPFNGRQFTIPTSHDHYRLLQSVKTIAERVTGVSKPISEQGFQPAAASSMRPSPAPINLTLVDKSRNMFNRGSTTIVHQAPKTAKEKEADRNRNQQIAVGMIGTIVALVATYFFAKEMNAGDTADAETADFHDKIEGWKQTVKAYPQEEYVTTLNRAIHNATKIEGHEKIMRQRKIILIGSAIAVSFLGVSGALMGATAVTTAAIGLGVLVSLGAIYFAVRKPFAEKDKISAAYIFMDIQHIMTLRQVAQTV